MGYPGSLLSVGRPWHQSCLIFRQRHAPLRREKRHENSRRLRDRLRMPAADAHGADAERAPLAHGRPRRPAPHRLRSAHRGKGLSRRLRQHLHARHCPAGASDGRDRFRHQRSRHARRRRAGRRAGARPGSARRRSRLSARQPLLRHRSPLQHGLVDVRQRADRLGAGAGDLRLCPRAAELRLSARLGDTHRLGRLSRAARRVPGFRPPRHHAVPLHEHPGALLHGLPGRHRRARRRPSPWTSAPGSRSISAGAGTRSMRATTRRASAAS